MCESKFMVFPFYRQTICQYFRLFLKTLYCIKIWFYVTKRDGFADFCEPSEMFLFDFVAL